MISKERFTEIINDIDDWDCQFDKLSEYLLVENPLNKLFQKMTFELLNTLFTEEGVDWIEYYLYERPYIDDPKIEIDGEPVKLDTIDDLYNIIKNYQK